MMSLETPVVLMAFNRPELTARVLARVRAAKPRRMTVVCDGPRRDHASDREAVALTRKLFESGIDWPCELVRDYAEENLGCGPRVASGLNAAFERYDRAIVLEDDTLPEPCFFAYCEMMLDRYAEDPSVMHVSGSNAAVARGFVSKADAYRLIRFPEIWGWATWSRAWRHFDFGVSDWSEVRHTDWLARLVPDASERAVLHNAFRVQHERGQNRATWDWSWIYAVLRRGRAVTPMRNLITNIGFGIESTNCHEQDDPLAWLPSTSIDLDRLTAPEDDLHGELDAALMTHRFGGAKARRRASLFGRIRSDKLLRKLRCLVYGPKGRPQSSLRRAG